MSDIIETVLSHKDTILTVLIGGGLASLFKIGDKSVLSKLLSLFTTTPPAPAPGTPGVPGLDWVKLVSTLVERIAQRPAVPVAPLPPDKEPHTPEDVIKRMLELLNLAPGPLPGPGSPANPTHGDMEHLVACAQAVSAKYPDHDIKISIDVNGLSVSKVKREAVSVQPK